MNTKHVKLPFAIDAGVGRIVDADGNLVATSFGGTDEFIVHACNSHDALVKALQYARKWIREQMLDNGWPQELIDNPPAGSHVANIDAALAAPGVQP